MAFRLLQIVHNACLDFKYGRRFLAGVTQTPFADIGALETGNSDYAELPVLFGDLIKESDVIVEVGCGKGRVFNWLLSCGYRNRMVGVELTPEIANLCRNRLRSFKNLEIITGDVAANIPDDGTLFYLYNPFRERMMAAFTDSLKNSYLRNKRDIAIIYSNCWLLSMFEQDASWSVTPINANLRHPAAIIRLNPDCIE